MTYRCVCVFAIAAGLAAPAAQAADLRIPALGPYNWSGFYVGAHAGYGFASARQSVSAGGTLFQTAEDFDGALAGFQFGMNSQLGPLVLGLEGDFGWSWQGNRFNSSVGGVMLSLDSEIPWLATARGRAGFALDQWLLYGTAGLAVTEMRHSGSITVAGTTTALTGSEPQAAFVWGLGLETALYGSNVTARIEYLHVDTIDLAKTYSGIGASSTATNAVWRLGLNYRFGGGR